MTTAAAGVPFKSNRRANARGEPHSEPTSQLWRLRLRRAQVSFVGGETLPGRGAFPGKRRWIAVGVAAVRVWRVRARRWRIGSLRFGGCNDSGHVRRLRRGETVAREWQAGRGYKVIGGLAREAGAWPGYSCTAVRLCCCTSVLAGLG